MCLIFLEHTPHCTYSGSRCWNPDMSFQCSLSYVPYLIVCTPFSGDGNVLYFQFTINVCSFSQILTTTKYITWAFMSMSISREICCISFSFSLANTLQASKYDICFFNRIMLDIGFQGSWMLASLWWMYFGAGIAHLRNINSLSLQSQTTTSTTWKTGPIIGTMDTTFRARKTIIVMQCTKCSTNRCQHIEVPYIEVALGAQYAPFCTL